MKRLFDVTVAAVALVLALPVIAVLAVAIRRESEGPALFRQIRVGRDGKPFVCMKLRTMQQNAPQVPTHQSSGGLVTPLGRRLRRWKLDELPQLWNVLRGEMSFVGPRPCLPSQEELILERRKRGLYRLRPGITGIAQVQGVDMSDPVHLATLEAKYLDGVTLPNDIAILWRTFSRAALADRTAE